MDTPLLTSLKSVLLKITEDGAWYEYNGPFEPGYTPPNKALYGRWGSLKFVVYFNFNGSVYSLRIFDKFNRDISSLTRIYSDITEYLDLLFYEQSIYREAAIEDAMNEILNFK